MLFRKKIQRFCDYCRFGTKLNCDQILCMRRGIVAPNNSCGKFQYDPCKRIPPKPKAANFAKYNEEDFTL